MTPHMDEWELLRRFAQEGSQDAFAEVVRRQLDFVYSCARRQVRSPELAQEVAQAVFLELARQAGTLERGSPLSSWLYLVTRRTALNALRGELRRQAREHAAYELSAMNHEPSVWQKLEPLLDEALETLHPRDRSALLLRYFENKPLREVGAALGASEDAAQKRVTRALDHLRGFFAKQGVPITAVGLAAHLSANAVEAAPAALGGVISSATGALAASAGPTATLALEATHVVAMTTLQKSLLVGALVAIGASLYQVRALGGQRGRVAALEGEAARLADRESAARKAGDAAHGRMVVARAEAARAIAALEAAEPKVDPAIAEIVGRVNTLKNHFATNPAARIPEMVLLDEGEWFQIARERSVATEEGLRVSLARLRQAAKWPLIQQVTRGLAAYVKANDGRMPATTRDLQPYITALPVDAAALAGMLARYRLPAQGRVTDVAHEAVVLIEDEPGLVDRDFDYQVRVTRMLSRPDPDPYRISFSNNQVPGPRAAAPTMFLR
jgi:RNA polymerase sigma factor (sigma-70 family)